VAQPAAAIVDSGYSEVFAYRFDWDELPRFLGADLSALFGAAHGFEIPFVFGNFDLTSLPLGRVIFDETSQPGRLALSSQMMGYWAEFARIGRPGRGGRVDQPTWPHWTQRRFTNESIAAGSNSPTAQLMVFDTPEGGGIRLAAMNHSRDHVIAAVDAELGLDQNEKCALFLDLFSSRPEWTLEEHRRIGQRGCADFPPSDVVR
jgi:para-nitrobenzyl esterase